MVTYTVWKVAWQCIMGQQWHIARRVHYVTIATDWDALHLLSATNRRNHIDFPGWLFLVLIHQSLSVSLPGAFSTHWLYTRRTCLDMTVSQTTHLQHTLALHTEDLPWHDSVTDYTPTTHTDSTHGGTCLDMTVSQTTHLQHTLTLHTEDLPWHDSVTDYTPTTHTGSTHGGPALTWQCHRLHTYNTHWLYTRRTCLDMTVSQTTHLQHTLALHTEDLPWHDSVTDYTPTTHTGSTTHGGPALTWQCHRLHTYNTHWLYTRRTCLDMTVSQTTHLQHTLALLHTEDLPWHDSVTDYTPTTHTGSTHGGPALTWQCHRLHTYNTHWLYTRRTCLDMTVSQTTHLQHTLALLHTEDLPWHDSVTDYTPTTHTGSTHGGPALTWQCHRLHTYNTHWLYYTRRTCLDMTVSQTTHLQHTLALHTEDLPWHDSVTDYTPTTHTGSTTHGGPALTWQCHRLHTYNTHWLYTWRTCLDMTVSQTIHLQHTLALLHTEDLPWHDSVTDYTPTTHTGSTTHGGPALTWQCHRLHTYNTHWLYTWRTCLDMTVSQTTHLQHTLVLHTADLPWHDSVTEYTPTTHTLMSTSIAVHLRPHIHRHTATHIPTHIHTYSHTHT